MKWKHNISKCVRYHLKQYLGGTIALKGPVWKEERPQISGFIFFLKKLEKEEQNKSKSRVKKIIMMRADINKIENRKIEKNQWNQKLVFEMIDKTDKHLARLSRKKKKKDTYQYKEWEKWHHYRLYRYLYLIPYIY